MADSTVKQDSQTDLQSQKEEQADNTDTKTEEPTKTHQETKEEPKEEPKKETKEEPKKQESKDTTPQTPKEDTKHSERDSQSACLVKNGGHDVRIAKNKETDALSSQQRRHSRDHNRSISTVSLTDKPRSNQSRRRHTMEDKRITFQHDLSNDKDGGGNTYAMTRQKTKTDNDRVEGDRADDTAQVLAALGIDACVNDISPDPVTPNEELLGNAPVVYPEDSFFDWDERGDDQEEKFVGVSETMATSQTINFLNHAGGSKTSSEMFGKSAERSDHVASDTKLFSCKEESHHRTAANDGDDGGGDMISNSSIGLMSVQEEIEKAKSGDEGEEEEARGELAPETPRTPEIEDEIRAEENIAQSVTSMAHPGTGRKEKPEPKRFLFQSPEEQNQNQNGSKRNYSDLSESARGDFAKQNSEIVQGSRDARAGEVRRVTGWSGTGADSVESESPAKIDVIAPSASPFSSGFNMYADSFVSLESTPNRSVNCTPLNKQNSHMNGDEFQSQPKSGAGRQKSEKEWLDKMEASKSKMEGSEEKSDDLLQTLDFDFQQAMMDFDLNVEVKAESVFKANENNEIPHTSVTDENYSPQRRPLILMGKKHDLTPPPVKSDGIHALDHNTDAQKIPEIKLESPYKDNTASPNQLTLQEKQQSQFVSDNLNLEEISEPRGDEVIPKVHYSYGQKLEDKRSETGSSKKFSGNWNVIENVEDNGDIIEKKDINATSCVDEFDNFDSRHLAMFQSPRQEETAIDEPTALTNPSQHVAQRMLSHEQRENGNDVSQSFDIAKTEVSALGRARTMLHASRPISRSATDLRPSMARTGSPKWTPRPRTTQTMTRRGESDTRKGHAQNPPEENAKGEQQNEQSQKSSDSDRKESSADHSNEDNNNDKNTKSVKWEDSKKREKKTSNEGQKDNTKADKTKKSTKGSNNQKQNNEGQDKGVKKEESNEDKEEEDKKEENKNTDQEGSRKNTPRESQSELSDGRTKQKEFFKLELQRLETGLKRESSKISAPSKKPHTPYIFNTLEPYYNTQITRFLVEMPEEIKHGHTSRRTAQGLTDPWVDLKMDRDILPKVASRPVSRQVAILKREKELRERKKRSAATQSSSSRKGGSTRLPKFPVVHLETQDIASRQLFYSDVPYLRTELKNKYSSSAKSKVDEDYKRTQQDFFRMELDKLDEVHPVNRRHMKSAYFAYLQNTPGSKKAISDCVRGLESGKAQ